MRNIFRCLLLIAFYLLNCSETFSQLNISGVVKDAESNESLPVVVVRIKGTMTATITDSQGKFKIVVPDTSTILMFSMLGYDEQEIKTLSNEPIEIRLKRSIYEIENVVVVGYGKTIRRNLTSSISKVDAKEIGSSLSNSIDLSLQGKASGVQIIQSSGAPGSASLVRIRGLGTLMGNSQPLYVVDGIPILADDKNQFEYGPDNNSGTRYTPLSDINAKDIESIEVLKDASACAMYGARGGNGVILITTKKGKAGKSELDINFTTGFSRLSKPIEFINADQWRDIYYNDLGFKTYLDSKIMWDVNTTTGSLAQRKVMSDSLFRATNINWMDEFLRIAPMNEISASASGGNEKTTYYISASLRKEDGVMIHNSFDQASTRFNISSKVKEKLTVGLNSNLSYSSLEGVPPTGGWIRGPEARNDFEIGGGNNMVGGFQMASLYGMPWKPIYDPENPSNFYDIGTENLNPAFSSNPIAAISPLFMMLKRQTNRSQGNLYAQLDLLKGLSFRSEAGTDIFNSLNNMFRGKEINANHKAWATDGRTTNIMLTTNNYFSFDRNFGDNHAVNATLGTSFETNTSRFSNQVGYDIPNNALRYTSSAAEPVETSSDLTKSAYLSYFVRMGYTFLNRYIVQFSVRRDGSSKFGSENRYGNFPAISGAWIISDESFLKENKVISFLKLRSSWGIVGDANIPDYMNRELFTVGNEYNYNGKPGLFPKKLANPNVKWEKQNQVDMSLEYGFLNNRINGSVGYYDKRAYDMFFVVSGSLSVGLKPYTPEEMDDNYQREYVNTGSIRNRGFEFNTNVGILSKSDFSWQLGLNGSLNRTSIESVGISPEKEIAQVDQWFMSYAGATPAYYWLLSAAGVDPRTGYMLYYDVEDNGDYVKDAEGYVVVKNTKDMAAKLNDDLAKLGYDRLMKKVEKITSQNDPLAKYRKLVKKSMIPVFTGGVQNTLRFHDFELSIFASYSVGGHLRWARKTNFSVGNATNYETAILDRWQKPGDVTEIPKPINDLSNLREQIKYFGGPSNLDVWDASYIKLKNVRLSYSLSDKIRSRLKVQDIKIFISGQNLLTLTRFPGWDPEVASPNYSGFKENLRALGEAGDVLPPVTTFGAGIQIKL